MTDRLPTYFISHGGGPWPWLPDLRRKPLSEVMQWNPRGSTQSGEPAPE